jgi:hypothetical protein
MNSQKLIELVRNIKSTDDMKRLLPFSNPENGFRKGKKITAINKMDDGYTYVLSKNIGEIDDEEFTPYFTPGEMLEYGVFEGKYLNDCILEFPKEWYENALKQGTLSPEGPDVNCNFFGIKSRMNLQDWVDKGWIPQIEGDPDNRGWFQWYCRYYIGRRIPKLDMIQIKRWKAFKRHSGQVSKNCSDLDCRPKQRQALLQWAYDAFVVNN